MAGSGNDKRIGRDSGHMKCNEHGGGLHSLATTCSNGDNGKQCGHYQQRPRRVYPYQQRLHWSAKEQIDNSLRVGALVQCIVFPETRPVLVLSLAVVRNTYGKQRLIGDSRRLDCTQVASVGPV